MATRLGRPGTIPRLPADSISGRGAAGSEGLCELRSPHGRLCGLASSQSRGHVTGCPRRDYELCHYFGSNRSELNNPRFHPRNLTDLLPLSVRQGQFRGCQDACRRRKRTGQPQRGHIRSEANKSTDRENGQLVSQQTIESFKDQSAHMSTRVSMLVMGHPQFETQDDVGIGDGIPPIPEWHLDHPNSMVSLADVPKIDNFAVRNVLIRLSNVFQRAQRMALPPSRLHDLTCFVIHRLLLSISNEVDSASSPVSECTRYAIILYMFVVQGPTYYSHAVLMEQMVIRFVHHLKQLESTSRRPDSFDVWLLAIGLEASAGSQHNRWVVRQARALAVSLQLGSWSDVLIRTKKILWLETPKAEDKFCHSWDVIFHGVDEAKNPVPASRNSQSRPGTNSA